MEEKSVRVKIADSYSTDVKSAERAGSEFAIPACRMLRPQPPVLYDNADLLHISIASIVNQATVSDML